MKKKIIGMLVCMLLIASVLPVMGLSKEDWYVKERNESVILLDPIIQEEIHYVLVESTVKDRASKEVIVNRQGNLAPNPSFEEGTTTPTGWEHSDFGHGVVYRWDSSDAHNGEKSVGISNVQQDLCGYCWRITELIPVDLLENDYLFSVWYRVIGEPVIDSQIIDIAVMPYDNDQNLLGVVVIYPLSPTSEWTYDRILTSELFIAMPEILEQTKYVKLLLDHWFTDTADSSVDASFDDVFFGIGASEPPEKPSKPEGPPSGKINSNYQYSSSTTDPTGDQISYLFSWGDGTDSGWTDPIPSGKTASASHIWTSQGTYEIKVKARDIPNFVESEWADPLSVSMPRNKPYTDRPFLNFLQNVMERFPLFERLIRL